ncbi:MAG: sigma-70 family RNA polymerase sigma factor [Phycisphaerales bacterium]
MSSSSSKQISDGELEVLCRTSAAGDVSSLTRLLTFYHDRLHEHAVRRVGPDWGGKLDPEDVLQDAYFDIFADIRLFEYRGRDSFYYWAAQIVDRRHVDQVRRLRAQKRDVARERSAAPAGSNTSSYQKLIDQHLTLSGTPSRAARTREAVGATMCGFARLPEDYRLVLRRVYLNGERVAMVAAELGRSEDAVRRLADRALSRLREIVSGTPA